MNDRPNLKQIRIKRSVCDRLDERKGKDDSYTDVIKDLLDENERLTARCEELQQDKEVFIRLALTNPNDNFEGKDTKRKLSRLSKSQEQGDRLKSEFDDALQS